MYIPLIVLQLVIPVQFSGFGCRSFVDRPVH
jgi:hypothetical protein